MERYEYLKLKLCDIPEEIIREYNLLKIATPDKSVYVEVRKGMYGLPQAGIIANELLEKRLNKKGYFQSKLVPGLWTHEWRPISFTLVVDNFGVKYTRKEDVHHLMGAFKKNYERSRTTGRAGSTSVSRSIGTTRGGRYTCPCRGM